MKNKITRKVSFGKWLKIAEELTKKHVKWHEHYLFPNCIFNKKKKYVAILENEETKEVFISEGKKHKSEDLKKLEKLVFKNAHFFKS